jgi:hypothetical protein
MQRSPCSTSSLAACRGRPNARLRTKVFNPSAKCKDIWDGGKKALAKQIIERGEIGEPVRFRGEQALGLPNRPSNGRVSSPVSTSKCRG